jgi:hypothetical protein
MLTDTDAIDRLEAAERNYTAAREQYTDALMQKIEDLFKSAEYKFYLICNRSSRERLQSMFSDAHNGEHTTSIATLTEWFSTLPLDEKIALLDATREPEI